MNDPFLQPDSSSLRQQGIEATQHLCHDRIHTKTARHLDACPSCQQAKDVIDHLLAIPDLEPSPDLTARIMADVKQEQSRTKRSAWWPRAAAAVFLIGLSVTAISIWSPRSKPMIATTPSPRTSLPVDQGRQEAWQWFCRTQESNGSWNPTRWGGDARFEVALTALPLLALQSAEGEKTAEQKEVIRKAQQYLLSRCDDQGRFGPSFFGSSYTQGMATLAMLSCYRTNPDPEIKRVLHRALDVIISQQQPSGCWCAVGIAQPDVTVTLWQLEALKAASALGWDEVQPHVSLGSKWLTSHRSESPQNANFDPDGKIDYFQLYSATTQLRESVDASAHDQLTAIRRRLLLKQIQQGDDSGSWSPDDRWAMIGGRLYTTAMASLALR